ncbi:hypothetical protein ABZ590_18910 [Streptomyces hirsutus]|uniref:hypothetical protein n=1 Tax=Streptomyces hirsutus TaxID=35620 RepID=UPI0033CB9001
MRSGRASALAVGGVAGAVSNAVLAAVFFAWAGRHHVGVHLHLPAGRYVLPAIALILAAGGLLGITPPRTAAPGRTHSADCQLVPARPHDHTHPYRAGTETCP